MTNDDQSRSYCFLAASASFQRVTAARRAISERRAGDKAFALAGPPFTPPSLPRATAAGFLVEESILSKTRFASSIGSLVLDRLRMNQSSHPAKGDARRIDRDFKLTHYQVLSSWQRCFVDHRTFRRAQEHALAVLVGLGRRTLSRSICVLGRKFRNGTPDYRWFSRCRWKPPALFDAVLAHLPALLSPSQPWVAALDDTPCRKTGKRIRAAKILRDALSPPSPLILDSVVKSIKKVMAGHRFPIQHPARV
jgi:hypothetical protein